MALRGHGGQTGVHTPRRETSGGSSPVHPWGSDASLQDGGQGCLLFKLPRLWCLLQQPERTHTHRPRVSRGPCGRGGGCCSISRAPCASPGVRVFSLWSPRTATRHADHLGEWDSLFMVSVNLTRSSASRRAGVPCGLTAQRPQLRGFASFDEMTSSQPMWGRAGPRNGSSHHPGPGPGPDPAQTWLSCWVPSS